MVKRYLSTAPIGFAVTLGLLYAMQILIDSGEAVLKPPRDVDMLGWIAQPPIEDPPRVDRPPERISPPADPPRLPPPTSPEPADRGVFVAPGPADPPPAGSVEFNPYNSDGPLVHMVRVQPAYPPIAASRGIEGFVTVRFDVTPEGLASNVTVVESSHAIFERAAVKAAHKFRFKPKVVDGTAVASTGVVYRFRFEMDR